MYRTSTLVQFSKRNMKQELKRFHITHHLRFMLGENRAIINTPY